MDKYGQSLMHEVAREWNTDVAVYLKSKGANIDIPDNWGRTPLFVAASSNHYKMVEWLIHNGGIDILYSYFSSVLKYTKALLKFEYLLQ